MSYPVNRTLWEGIESVFLANARSLLRDIAHELEKPEKELLKSFSEDMVKLRLYDTDESTDHCMALDTSTEVAKRCRKPVYSGTCFCPFHHQFESAKPKTDQYLTRLQIEDCEDIYFVDQETSIVYNDSFTPMGLYENKKLTLFKLEEQSTE